jgi:FAD/FMN-containing dehydrogenase
MVKPSELVRILGADNVLDDPAVLEQYSADISFERPVQPRYVVRPGNASQVQALVRWASRTSTRPLPVSSGGPHFHGDTIPAVAGTVIVDLQGMKRIVRTDARNRIVLIEPGVTFGELSPALEKEGLRLNLPLLPRASKSVVTAALEREPVIMPKYHWDGSDPLACTEVIYGTGDRFRTGSAAGSGDLDYQ